MFHNYKQLRNFRNRAKPFKLAKTPVYLILNTLHFTNSILKGLHQNYSF